MTESALGFVLHHACASSHTESDLDEGSVALFAEMHSQFPFGQLAQDLTALLSHEEAFERQSSELFRVALGLPSSAGDEFLISMSFDQLYVVTQRVIDFLGCRDPVSLGVIAEVYGVTASACKAKGGVGFPEFSHHMRALLTQVLAELRVRPHGGAHGNPDECGRKGEETAFGGVFGALASGWAALTGSVGASKEEPPTEYQVVGQEGAVVPGSMREDDASSRPVPPNRCGEYLLPDYEVPLPPARLLDDGSLRGGDSPPESEWPALIAVGVGGLDDVAAQSSAAERTAAPITMPAQPRLGHPSQFEGFKAAPSETAVPKAVSATPKPKHPVPLPDVEAPPRAMQRAKDPEVLPSVHMPPPALSQDEILRSLLGGTVPAPPMKKPSPFAISGGDPPPPTTGRSPWLLPGGDVPMSTSELSDSTQPPPEAPSWVHRAKESLVSGLDSFADRLDAVFAPAQAPSETPEGIASLGPSASRQRFESGAHGIEHDNESICTEADTVDDNHLAYDAGGAGAASRAFYRGDEIPAATHAQDDFAAPHLGTHASRGCGQTATVHGYSYGLREGLSATANGYSHERRESQAVAPPFMPDARFEDYADYSSPGFRSPSEAEAIAMLRQERGSREGLPAYAAVGRGWEPRRLALGSGGRCLYVVEEGELVNGNLRIDEETPSFEVRDLRQVTRRSGPALYFLSLQFEEGTLVLRFSYEVFRVTLVCALVEGRRIPVVDARD